MKVVLKVWMSGTRDGEDWPARGGTIDLPKDEAEAMIAAGNAVLPGDAPAEDGPVEQATAVPGQKRQAKRRS